MKALKTMATTAVVKNVLQRRALRHLKQGEEEAHWFSEITRTTLTLTKRVNC